MTVLVIIAVFIAGAESNSWYYNIDSLYEANQSKKELINAYDNYNKHCENLLDSIAKYDDSFGDVVAETDAYVEYLEAREKLDSLLWDK